ncbi:MAG: hypothetical protein JWP88_2319 [Flaviaesturariibacter sp.]|nr:hypothetical protein [Flaviaesturariibacter sp.]
MKQILSTFSIALIMVACNTAPKTTAVTTDTAGLAGYQAMQVQHQKDSVAQWVKDSINSDTRAAKATYVSHTATRSSNSSSRPSASSNGNTTTTTTSSESSNTASRSRVSKTAKGAIIGGVAGAAGGAIINKKNRAAGAVIGGVLGAGTGAVIGRGMDKRDGRH